MKLIMRLYWWRDIAYVEHNGKRTSLKTKNKDEAKRLYAAFKKKVLAGKVATIEGRCTKTLKDFADEYVKWAEAVQPHSTFRANRLALEKLKQYAGEKITLDRIGIKHLDMMAAGSAQLSPHSVNNYIRHARVVLNKAREWGYIQTNPFREAKEIKAPKRAPTFLSASEISGFLKSIRNIHLRRLVVAYLATGRRRSELLGLRKTDIDLEAGRYRVIGKGNVEKHFRINGTFRAVLHHCMAAKGERVFSAWSHPDTISHYVKKALIAAGLGRFHLHHLRHTFASHKAMEGRSIKEIQELLGHEDIKATMIYSHLTEEHMAEISEVNLGPVDLQGD